jgi:predicted nucleic acid-binding protein
VILVDTSVWIDLFSRKPRGPIGEQEVVGFVTCGPIVQELVQGLKPGRDSDDFREALLALPVLCDPVPLRLFLSAADIFQLGRRRGLTIRSSVDCLIAAIAIDQRVPVWHRDRDFDAIARYTALETVHAIC